jgi:uncharacterized membrane protein
VLVARFVDHKINNHLWGDFVKKRIWELDALRGLFILGMLAVHLIYDLQSFLGSDLFRDSVLYDFLSSWGGSLFFLISGICVTLGSHPVRRGLIVIGCGLIVSAVTWGLYLLDFAGKGMIIYFGVLHCLGTCMLLWPLFRRIPWYLTAPIALFIILYGIYLDSRNFDCSILWMPLGFTPRNFYSSDYFALMPFFGFFLAGTLIGKFAYAKKTTLFPKVNPENPVIRFFSLLGRWSLPIYLLHQPVLTGIVILLEVLV